VTTTIVVPLFHGGTVGVVTVLSVAQGNDG